MPKNCMVRTSGRQCPKSCCCAGGRGARAQHSGGCASAQPRQAPHLAAWRPVLRFLPTPGLHKWGAFRPSLQCSADNQLTKCRQTLPLNPMSKAKPRPDSHYTLHTPTEHSAGSSLGRPTRANEWLPSQPRPRHAERRITSGASPLELPPCRRPCSRPCCCWCRSRPHAQSGPCRPPRPAG